MSDDVLFQILVDRMSNCISAMRT